MSAALAPVQTSPRTTDQNGEVVWEDGIFYFDGSLQHLMKGSAYFATTEERDAIFAQLPKSCKAKKHGLSTRDRVTGETIHLPGISIFATLKATGVNGGVNETGIKRLRSFIIAARKAGLQVRYRDDMWSNGASAPEFNDIIGAAA